MIEIKAKAFMLHRSLEKYLKENLNEGWEILNIHDSIGWTEVILFRDIADLNPKTRIR